MGHVQVSNLDDLRYVLLPEGLYPAVINVCEVRPLKNDPSNNKVYWEFRIQDADEAKWNGRLLIAHTSLAPNKGAVYIKFVEGLGLDPKDFRTEEVEGAKIYVQVGHREGKDQAGNPRQEETIQEIRPR